MDDPRWERYGALGGVAFVVLDVVVTVLGGVPPATDASASEVAAYYVDHGAGLRAGLWLFGLACVALTFWLGALWRRMVAAEGGTARLAVVSLIGLALAGSLSLASSAVAAATALRIEDTGDVRLLHTLTFLLLSTSSFGMGAHLLATNVLAERTQMLPRWVVALGFASAVAFLATAVLGIATEGSTAGVVGTGAFLAWCAWILGVSARMWRHDEAPALVHRA